MGPVWGAVRGTDKYFLSLRQNEIIFFLMVSLIGIFQDLYDIEKSNTDYFTFVNLLHNSNTTNK